MVAMKLPMLNCVDGSDDGVAVYAPAEGLIRNIDRNEAQMNGEFSRGESRVFASRDLLDKELGLQDHLFVGLDDDPERGGLTVFSPKICITVYISGELSLPVTATRKNILTSATFPRKASGVSLYAFISEA